jgi:hypothetical protein
MNAATRLKSLMNNRRPQGEELLNIVRKMIHKHSWYDTSMALQQLLDMGDEEADNLTTQAQAQNSLYNIMAEVVHHVQSRLKSTPDADHCDLCNDAAERFGLWGPDNEFPIWLSRIIEGIMRDYPNEDHI